MMIKKDMKRSIESVALIVLICAALMATVSGAQIASGKNYPLFSPHGIGQAYTGNTDTVKAGAHLVYPSYNTITRRSPYTPPNYSRPKFSLSLTYYPSITPVPEQPSGATTTPGTTSSALGGIIIRGTEGAWIDMRSNFYNPSQILYDGRWHNHVGTVPVYWENMLLPGSYTIRVDNGYCETVTVYPGQTVELQVIGGMCPFCSSC